MTRSEAGTRTKARHTKPLIIALVVMVGLSFAGVMTAAQEPRIVIPTPIPTPEEGNVTWEGQGSENVGECEFGYHWVFTTGGAVVDNVTLHTQIENVSQPPIPMDQSGPSGTQSAWHANTTIVDTEEGETPWVTFDIISDGQGNKILTISDCAEPPDNGPPDNGPPDEVCVGPQSISGFAEANPPTNSISWSAFEGATGYNLYRATEGGPFELLVQTDGNTTSHDDLDVDVGVTYQYRVTAQVGERETDHCDEVEVTAIPVFTSLIAAAAAAAIGLGAYAVSRRRD